MNISHRLWAAGLLSLGLPVAMAQAQTEAQTPAVEVSTGTQIYGPQGGLVGTITTVADNVATLDTGSHKVGLPLDRFGRNDQGQTTIAVTQAQLNEMAAQSQAEAGAKLDAVLVAGTSVLDVNGAALGSVAGVEGEEVTVETQWGAFVLKKENFVPGEGQVTARVEAAQVQSALGGAETPTS